MFKSLIVSLRKKEFQDANVIKRLKLHNCIKAVNNILIKLLTLLGPVNQNRFW